MKIPSLFFLAFVFALVSGAYADTSSCTGFTSVGETVYGTCTDGSFDGYESTGAVVYGSCSGGEFFGNDGAGISSNGSCTEESVSGSGVSRTDVSSCTGSNMQDGGVVYGTCDGGIFSGYETSNGASVQGSCSGSQFSGYTNTGAMVSGSCTPEFDSN